jgi:hypothetical protein
VEAAVPATVLKVAATAALVAAHVEQIVLQEVLVPLDKAIVVGMVVRALRHVAAEGTAIRAGMLERVVIPIRRAAVE